MAKKAKGPQGPKRVNSRKSSARKPTNKKPSSAAKKSTDKSRKAGQYSKVDVPSPAERAEKKKARKKLGKGAKPASPVVKGSKKSPESTGSKPRKFREIDRSKYPPEPITWRQQKNGKWVGWANEPMKFKVEASDIVKATTRDGRKCVLAMALRRSFFGLLDGFVVGKYVSKIYSDNGNRIVEYETPAKLRDAVRQFDRYGNWPLDVNEEVRFLPFPLNRRESRHDKRKKPQAGRKPSEYAVIVDGFKRIAPTVCQIAAGNV
jgi:hypothetical protein